MLVGKCAVVAGALNARSIGWHVADAWRAGERVLPRLAPCPISTPACQPAALEPRGGWCGGSHSWLQRGIDLPGRPCTRPPRAAGCEALGGCGGRGPRGRVAQCVDGTRCEAAMGRRASSSATWRTTPKYYLHLERCVYEPVKEADHAEVLSQM